MIGALLYLQVRSSANRLASQIKRLKKPKYLAGFLVGGAYFYFYFFRYLFKAGRPMRAPVPELPLEFSGGYELLAAVVVLVLILFKWVLPNDRAALAFTEAEVTFLFPAPISRRTLIHFKLMKSQAGILFTTLLMAFLSNRFGQRGHAAFHILGWWMVLSTLNLHSLGASFVRTKLLDSGITNWQRRLAILFAVAATGGLVVLWAARTIPPPTDANFANVRSLWAYVRQVLGTGPALFLLYPFRLMVRPFLTPDVSTFLLATAPAAAILILHYGWVIRSNVAFEEASVDLARKRAEMISSARHGPYEPGHRKAKREPFRLGPTGPAYVALLWKNLIATGSMFTLRMWIILAFAFGLPALMFSFSSGGSKAPPIVGWLVVMALFWSLLAGPQLLRQDFRQDLRIADILKMYPLAGWRVVLGELLAPAAILSAVQWLLLLFGALALSRGPDGAGIPVSARLSVAVGAAMILPMLNLVSLLIPNAAVLLFPGWFQSGQDRTQGIEATGQRLIFALGQLLVFLVSLIPAVAAFALVFFLLRIAASWIAAVPVASVAAAIALGLEAALGIGLLGRVFERFDLSAESQA